VALAEGDGDALALNVGVGLASALALGLELGDSVTVGLALALGDSVTVGLTLTGIEGLLDGDDSAVVSSDPVRASSVTSVVGEGEGSDAGD
jgi:UDP-3-O-[3-hydroxymyristoyl] glucosamine N-acyltransferase